MKKWHMEGIIQGANNSQKKLVIEGRDQMYLCSGIYAFEPKKNLSRNDILNRLVRFFFGRRL